MVNLIHLIPFDGVGGVEVAAKSIIPSKNRDINLRIEYIFKDVDIRKNYWSTFNPLKFIMVAWQVARSDVDILIVSLWRSSLVGLLAKSIRPRLKIITFLHLDRNVHLLDFIFTNLTARLSIEIWADSQATLTKRIPNLQSINRRVISFVTQRLQPLPEKNVGPSFIFWGRLCQQKDLIRAIRLFSEFLKHRPDATFTIIGPDAGSLNDLKSLCVSMGLTNSVSFIGPVPHNKIMDYAQHASFYLQTSLMEGMAMSVVEAMQFGLIPVVTAVGEIATYCKDDFNAVLVTRDKESVRSVFELLNNKNRYQEIRRNAIETWLNKPIYRDSLLDACSDIVAAFNID